MQTSSQSFQWLVFCRWSSSQLLLFCHPSVTSPALFYVLPAFCDTSYSIILDAAGLENLTKPEFLVISRRKETWMGNTDRVKDLQTFEGEVFSPKGKEQSKESGTQTNQGRVSPHIVENQVLRVALDACYSLRGGSWDLWMDPPFLLKVLWAYCPWLC